MLPPPHFQSKNGSGCTFDLADKINDVDFRFTSWETKRIHAFTKKTRPILPEYLKL